MTAFAKVGIGPAQPLDAAHLSSLQRRALQRALERGPALLKGGTAGEARRGWSVPMRLGESWGDDWWLRAVVALKYIVLVGNRLDRYRIGDRRRGLVRDPDGSLTIDIRHEPPGAAREPNRLPAPAGDFYLCLRAYQPRAEMLDGRYRLPDIVRVD